MPTRKLPNPDDFRGQKFYIGIDVHKKSWAVTVRSLNFVVAHFTQPPSPAALLSQLQRKFPGGEHFSTYEAGFGGTSAHEELCKLGIKNIIVHPGDIPRTDKEKKKTRQMSMTAVRWPFTSKKATSIRFICYPGNSRSSGPYFAYGSRRQGMWPGPSTGSKPASYTLV